jgi:hypothetical protein
MTGIGQRGSGRGASNIGNVTGSKHCITTPLFPIHRIPVFRGHFQWVICGGITIRTGTYRFIHTAGVIKYNQDVRLYSFPAGHVEVRIMGERKTDETETQQNEIYQYNFG